MREVLLGDGEQRDFGDVEFALLKQVQQQRERTFEHWKLEHERGGGICYRVIRCLTRLDYSLCGFIASGSHGYATGCATGGGTGANGRPTAVASIEASCIMLAKFPGVSDCAPSESA